jgi:hypothetical protein
MVCRVAFITFLKLDDGGGALTSRKGMCLYLIKSNGGEISDQGDIAQVLSKSQVHDVVSPMRAFISFVVSLKVNI